MPTYDYLCKNCEHEFEKFQSMTDKPLKKCPKCGGKVQRLIGSGAGVVFKGSGFYETDYKKSSASSSSTNKPVAKSCGEGCKSCPAKKE